MEGRGARGKRLKMHHTVWVNGTVVYREGKATGAFPGRVIRR
jgi:N-acyl-D-aspartate/D-glutamate deacylase